MLTALQHLWRYRIQGTILVGLLETAFGLDGGFFFYRVAGVFAANDKTNPGGESLPGEYFSIRLPKQVVGLTVELEWDHLPGVGPSLAPWVLASLALHHGFWHRLPCTMGSVITCPAPLVCHHLPC
jgi:hypothetical protein